MRNVLYPTARPKALITDEQIANDEIAEGKDDIETVELGGYQVDYSAIFKHLDVAEQRLEASLRSATDHRKVRVQDETLLGLELDQLTKHLPDRIVWDKRFWLYLAKNKPGWIKLRYTIRKTEAAKDGTQQGKATNRDRITGRPSRQALATATLVPRLLRKLGLDASVVYPQLGARARMWILDEVPLSDRRVMVGFIDYLRQHRTRQDDYLDKLWAQMAIRLGPIVVESLSAVEVEKLLVACDAAVP